MTQLLQENYDREIHGLLKFGHDAFGNKVKAEEGYRLLHHLERVEIGDRAFDIYNGWQETDGYDARNKHYANCCGRWTVWERRINHDELGPVSSGTRCTLDTDNQDKVVPI